MRGRAVGGVDAEVRRRAGCVGAGVGPRARLCLAARGRRGEPVRWQVQRRQHRAAVGGADVERGRAGADLEDGRRADGGLDGVEQGVADGGGELEGHTPHRARPAPPARWLLAPEAAVRRCRALQQPRRLVLLQVLDGDGEVRLEEPIVVGRGQRDVLGPARLGRVPSALREQPQRKPHHQLVHRLVVAQGVHVHADLDEVRPQRPPRRVQQLAALLGALLERQRLVQPRRPVGDVGQLDAVRDGRADDVEERVSEDRGGVDQDRPHHAVVRHGVGRVGQLGRVRDERAVHGRRQVRRDERGGDGIVVLEVVTDPDEARADLNDVHPLDEPEPGQPVAPAHLDPGGARQVDPTRVRLALARRNGRGRADRVHRRRPAELRRVVVERVVPLDGERGRGGPPVLDEDGDRLAGHVEVQFIGAAHGSGSHVDLAVRIDLPVPERFDGVLEQLIQLLGEPEHAARHDHQGHDGLSPRAPRRRAEDALVPQGQEQLEALQHLEL